MKQNQRAALIQAQTKWESGVKFNSPAYQDALQPPSLEEIRAQTVRRLTETETELAA